MKIITINLPELYLTAIQVFQDKGIYPSRSAAIRVALRDFLEAELLFHEELDEDTFRKIVTPGGNNHGIRT